MQTSVTLCDDSDMRTLSMRKIVAAGLLVLSLAGAKASSAQTQYPITPPEVLKVVDPSSPPAVTATPAATVLGTAVSSIPPTSNAPTSSAPSAVVAPAVVAEKAVAEVLGQTITATNTPAFTGSSTTKPLAAAGLSLVVAGLFFVLATRHRHRAAKPVQ